MTRGPGEKLKGIHLMSDATSRHEVQVGASAETKLLECLAVAAKAEVSASSGGRSSWLFGAAGAGEGSVA